MFYLGQFTKPAGLIYDNFDEETAVVPRFEIPGHWQRYIGLDFGGVNTNAVFYAEHPETNEFYAYREYAAGERAANGHVYALRQGEPKNLVAFGGSRSEGQWRREFAAGGLVVRPPLVKEVEVGVDRVYAGHANGRIKVFDDLDGYLLEKQNYSRVLDDDGNPTDQIEDKNRFHFMDAERYLGTYLFRPGPRQRARSRQG